MERRYVLRVLAAVGGNRQQSQDQQDQDPLSAILGGLTGGNSAGSGSGTGDLSIAGGATLDDLLDSDQAGTADYRQTLDMRRGHLAQESCLFGPCLAQRGILPERAPGYIAARARLAGHFDLAFEGGVVHAGRQHRPRHCRGLVDGPVVLLLEPQRSPRNSNKAFLKKVSGMDQDAWFIEQFIDGREFNLSILGGRKGPQVMPPAEILFKDYPKEKPKIVGFNAKWTEDSFEYNHTPRTFRFKKQDQPLLEELKSIALRCWHSFELKGYVRVDFRVDPSGKPYVLEINGNPCIAPESGYVAATKQAGLKFHQVVERIMEDALK